MYCVFSLLYQWAPSQSRSASLGLSILWDRAILKLGQLVTLQWPLVFKWKEKLHISPFSSLWTILNTFITDIFWTWAVTFHLGSISTEAKTQGKSSADFWKSFCKQLFLSLFFFLLKRIASSKSHLHLLNFIRLQDSGCVSSACAIIWKIASGKYAGHFIGSTLFFYSQESHPNCSLFSEWTVWPSYTVKFFSRLRWEG